MISCDSEISPLAIVRGEAFTVLPHDLYIPPDALEIFLETFTGPLDLLLYLIKKQNLDILDIPIAKVTQQYQEYIGIMQGLKLELAAEYLLMAAVLAEIKSRLLLPRLSSKEEEEDPRAELIRRLKEYEQIKQAAEHIDGLTRVERDTFVVSLPPGDFEILRPQPTVTLRELLLALDNALNRENWDTPHLIQRELFSVRQRMSLILEKLEGEDFISFQHLLHAEEGRLGVVVTLMAILELLKQISIEIVQTESYAPIHIKFRKP